MLTELYINWTSTAFKVTDYNEQRPAVGAGLLILNYIINNR